MTERYSEQLQKSKNADLNQDKSQISWSRALINNLKKNKEITFNLNHVFPILYRPFSSAWVYFDHDLNEMRYQLPNLFPEVKTKNPTIMIKARWRNGQIALATDRMPAFTPDGGEQCFSLNFSKREKEAGTKQVELSFQTESISEENITEIILDDFQKLFGKEVSRKDIFAYVYAILHSDEYLTKFKNDLQKVLPRIPIVRESRKFFDFVNAGNSLLTLHINYDDLKKYPIEIKEGQLELTHIENPQTFFRVEKMKFTKKGDKSSVIYNKNITIENIPLEAYEYVVNGKPALEWVMERQCVKTDKASGIVNDANDYANETMNNPAYPLELFQRVITVSLETMKIVRSLPKLDFD